MCSSDCLCQKLTYVDVVPFRNDANCPSDVELLTAWSEGECPQCLTWWVERVWIDPRYQQIVNYTQARWPKVAVLELRQEVTQAIWQQRERIDNPPAYFRTLLRNIASKQAKKIKQRKETPLDLSTDDVAVAEVPTTDPRVARLNDCLQKLSTSESDLVQKYYFQDKPSDQIAKALQTTCGAILKQLSRARAKLRLCVGREDHAIG